MAIREDLTLKKLEVFLAFMRLNHLGRVAEEFGQSAVSVHRALHSLEQALGCPLFKHEGRNLIPLDTAYTLSKHASRVIAECEEGIRNVRELAGVNASRLKIGALYSLTLQCIPRLIVGLKLRKAGLDVDLTLGSNQDLLRQLEERRLDAIVIGLDAPTPPGHLSAIPLFSDEVYLAVPADSPHARQSLIDLKNLQEENFVALSEGFITARSFQRAFEQADFKPRIGMQVGDIFSLINLVSGGMGCTLLPGRVAGFTPRIRLVRLKSQYVTAQHITLLFNKSREQDANILALAAECRMYGRSTASAGS